MFSPRAALLFGFAGLRFAPARAIKLSAARTEELVC